MSFTAVLDTELGGAPLVQAVQEVLADAAPALAFVGSDETDEAVVHHWRWQAADEEASLDIVEDTSMNVVYAVASAHPLRSAIVAAFGIFSAADVRDVVATDLANEHVRLPMLALCNSGTFDPETERVLIEASRHARADVRLSATQVMATLGWPALRAQMYAMRTEADPRIVRVLSRAAAVWSARARAEKDDVAAHVPVKKSFRKEIWTKRQGDGAGKPGGRSSGGARGGSRRSPGR